MCEVMSANGSAYPVHRRQNVFFSLDLPSTGAGRSKETTTPGGRRPHPPGEALRPAAPSRPSAKQASPDYRGCHDERTHAGEQYELSYDPVYHTPTPSPDTGAKRAIS